jgi:hypothetical protein
LDGGRSFFFFSVFFLLLCSPLLLFSSSVSHGAVVVCAAVALKAVMLAVFGAVFPVCAEAQVSAFSLKVLQRGKKMVS